jgi:hypothetical protein
MGEKIKSLGKFIYKDTEVEIELNSPPFIGLPEQVHIQSVSFRFEISKSEFVNLSTSVLLAAKNLKKLKGLD